MRTLALVLALAGAWPQWRGPARDGHATGFEPPASWPKALKAAWTAEIGEGSSSPVADAERVCAIARQGDGEVVSCFNRASGKPLWSDRYSSPFQKNSYAMRMAGGPFSTPLIHGARLFTLGVNAVLSAYDLATGKLLWRKQPPVRPATKNMFCGTALSPMIDEGRLVLIWGDDSQGEMLALDPATGKLLWSAPKVLPAYSSIAAGVIGGVRQYVALTTESVVGVEAATGKLLWTFPFADQWHENIQTPIIDGQRVIVSGVRKATMLLEPVKGPKWTVKVAWQAGAWPLYMSQPLVDGGLLYGLTSRQKGMLFSLNLASGVPLWSSEGRFADQAAIAMAGKWLLVLTDRGELIVMDKNGGKPVETARYELASTAVYAQPLLAGKQIVIKDERSLRAFLVP
jgi:outer membrane protein assembly factor BamB